MIFSLYIIALNDRFMDNYVYHDCNQRRRSVSLFWPLSKVRENDIKPSFLVMHLDRVHEHNNNIGC